MSPPRSALSSPNSDSAAPITQSSVRNQLLSGLTAADFALLENTERLTVATRHQLEQPNETIAHVYFPETALSSTVAVTASGERLEVGIVGRDGMTGLAVVHGNHRSPHNTFIQVPGESIRIGAEDLRRAMEASATMRRWFFRFAQVYSIQLAHTALANGRYALNERLARWLLMSHDRLEGDDLHLTHEFLSLMLGVRRAGVTTALQELEGKKIVRATRGHIKVLDRTRLEDCAGDCYGTPESEYARLMGAVMRK